jgi:hypothetical protein
MSSCIECSNPITSNGKFCSRSCGGKTNSRKRSLVVRQRYEANPKICKWCKSAISYERRKVSIFCNSVCSAKNSNLNRSKESRTKQSLALKITLRHKFGPLNQITPKIPKPETYLYSRVFLCVCDVTGKHFYSKYRKKYSSEAAMLHRKNYRLACNFKFSLYKYIEMVGYDLLLKYGIYHPTSNPGGVSRDHLHSVADGWKTKIAPDIMSHPANCHLVLHTFNNKKNTTSSVTINELLQLIQEWNSR